MEVESYLHAESWDELFWLAEMILRRWLSPEELRQLDRTLEERSEAGRMADRVVYRVLTDEHFTDPQRRFANRVGADGGAPRAWPWPAPERVSEEAIRALVDKMMDEPPSSPRARMAQLLLMIAACIEAANETERDRK